MPGKPTALFLNLLCDETEKRDREDSWALPLGPVFVLRWPVVSRENIARRVSLLLVLSPRLSFFIGRAI